QRGVGLTPLDLIKNLLLKRLVEITDEDEEQKNHIINERRDLFGDLWYEFTSKLIFEDLRRNPINSSTFLKHYLIGMQGKKITDKDLSFLKHLIELISGIVSIPFNLHCFDSTPITVGYYLKTGKLYFFHIFMCAALCIFTLHYYVTFKLP